MSTNDFDANSGFAFVPIIELARVVQQPDVGVAYADHLIRLRDSLRSVTNEPPTPLSVFNLREDAPWRASDAGDNVRFETLGSVASRNSDAVASLVGSYRSTLSEVYEALIESERVGYKRGGEPFFFQIDARLGVAVGPFAERVRSLFGQVAELQRAAESLARSIDWEFHRVWEAVGGAFLQTIDLEQAIEEAARLYE